MSRFRVWLCPLPVAPGPACLLAKEVFGLGSAELAADFGRFFPAGHAQLAQEVGDVDAGGLLADEQDVADLAVGAPFGDEAEYFGLAFGQAEPAGGLVRGWPGRKPASPRTWKPSSGEGCRAQGASRVQRAGGDRCRGGPVTFGAEQGVRGPVPADGGPVLVPAVVPRLGGGVPGLRLGPGAEFTCFGAGHRRERGRVGQQLPAERLGHGLDV